MERGVDVNISNCNGATALHCSCRWGHLSIVEYLTSLPQINYTKDSWGRTVIHFAVEFGQAHIVKYLVESCNHDINVEDKYGNTPLYMACIYNHLPVVESLTAQPNCNINSNNERHPLIAATDKEHLEIVKQLIKSSGCDINVREKGTGSTPLHKACYNGSLSIVEYLISKPQCDIEAIDNEGNQPLHYAASQGHKEIVSIVGKKVSQDGLSKCITSAKQLAEPSIMKLLIDHYKISLIDACESGNVDIVHHLVIDKHCDVNAKGRNGYTPLHYACEKGHFEIVKILTNHQQCNMEVENNFNIRPLELAFRSAFSSKTHMDIVNYLIQVKGCNTQGITAYDGKASNYLHIHQSSGIALLRVVKCILTGPPGAGKSTLNKRLLNQSLNTGPSLSTGVIDAAVQVNSFRKLSQHNAVVTTEWKEQELDEEAVLITKKLLPANNTSGESARPTAPHQSTLSLEDTRNLSFENQSRSPEEIDLSADQHDNRSVTSSPTFLHSEVIDAASSNEESSNMEHENITNSCRTPLNCEEEETTTDIKVQNSLKGLSDYVMKIPVRKREEYERKFEEGKDDNHTVLHIIDTGGQPEFHEILPALITGPAINLLVFKLTEDLRSRYEIIYRTSTGDSKPY